MVRPSQPPAGPIAQRRRFRTLAAAGAAIVLLGTMVPLLLTPSAGPTAPPPAAPADGPSLGGMLVRLTLGIVVAAAACVAVARLTQRRAARVGAADGPLRILASLAVNSRCSVYLVRVAGQTILAGVDATGVKTLTPLPAIEDEAELALANVRDTPAQVLAAKVRLSVDPSGERIDRIA